MNAQCHLVLAVLGPTHNIRFELCFGMIPAEASVLLNLYTQIAPGELFRLLQRNLGINVHDRVYTPRVVMWMMMVQRLDPRGTLSSTVEQLVQGKMDPLLSRCKRVKEKNIGLATGGYCQARQNLSKILIERSMEELTQRLRNHLNERMALVDRAVYVVDGSSVQLEDAKLGNAYPPAKNQHGVSHWPVARIVVVHDAETGLAQRPCWGPMFGPEAVSEQFLAEQAMDALPPGAVILGDRNFGIFSIAYHALQRGQAVVLRLTEKRARHLLGGVPSLQGDYALQWQPSKFERAKRPHLPAEAAISGRLVAWRVGRGKHQKWLYLFTTLTIAAEAVVALYGQRWNVETDLRGLKQTIRLHRICVQSVDMLEKELLIAVMAYNLVRGIMSLAARKAGIHPHQLSFTWAYNIVRDGYPSVLAAPSHEQQMQELERIVNLVARCKLPNRTKPRSYPREVWRPGYRYPIRRARKN